MKRSVCLFKKGSGPCAGEKVFPRHVVIVRVLFPKQSPSIIQRLLTAVACGKSLAAQVQERWLATTITCFYVSISSLMFSLPDDHLIPPFCLCLIHCIIRQGNKFSSYGSMCRVFGYSARDGGSGPIVFERQS